MDWGYLRGGWGHYSTWWRTCMVVLHEYGHLPGIDRPHSYRPGSIMAVSESLQLDAWWWPFHPVCRYDDDDPDGDGLPDR